MRIVLKPLGDIPAKDRTEYLLKSGSSLLFGIKEAGEMPSRVKKIQIDGMRKLRGGDGGILYAF
jgi:hypothetical protein